MTGSAANAAWGLTTLPQLSARSLITGDGTGGYWEHVPPAHGVGGTSHVFVPPPVTRIAASIPVSQHKEREAIWRHIMQETLRRPGLRHEPRWGSLQRSPRSHSWWEAGWLPLPKNPTPLSAIRASPLLSPTPKLVPAPLMVTINFDTTRLFDCDSTASQPFDDLCYDLLWAAALRPK